MTFDVILARLAGKMLSKIRKGRIFAPRLGQREG
jgi:hypothetical protein